MLMKVKFTNIQPKSFTQSAPKIKTTNKVSEMDTISSHAKQITLVLNTDRLEMFNILFLYHKYITWIIFAIFNGLYDTTSNCRRKTFCDTKLRLIYTN